ncbi:MAG: hypothetical protein JSU86_02640, partial [Phycisphaerales bacterium]
MIKDDDILLLDEPRLSPAERLYLPQIVDGMTVTLRHLGRSLFKRTITVQYPEEQRQLRVE